MPRDPKIRVVVDHETNAVAWWAALRQYEPVIARALERKGELSLSPTVFARLRALPGWTDGPDYAKTPLLMI